MCSLGGALLFFAIFHAANSESTGEFPPGFLFGVASSAYQIEGGHDAGDKGESIWDHHLHRNPDLVRDRSNGDVACDSYHKYREDVALLVDLGVDFYRFSISWSRILPEGHSNRVSSHGIRYYNALIDELVANKIEPMVTIYHWDMPKKLQDLGGWTNPLLADYFEDYARVLFENFGDRVKFWITFNVNSMGYGDNDVPPFIDQSGIANYLFAKVVLLSHARAYHLYDKEFRTKQEGKVGITIDGRWFQAASDSPEDQEAAERVREFFIGIYANPIYEGDWPQTVKDRVDSSSEKEGFARSRLPKFTREEIDYVRGSSDFLGLNIYTTFLIRDGVDEGPPSFNKDVKARFFQDEKWPKAHSDWLRVVPWGLRKVLNWIKDKYGNPPVFVTENGFSDRGQLDDVDRINYYKLHLGALLGAIHEDGVNAEGYTAWSLLDNFEWLSGYEERFGLHHVDFEDPNRTRTPKASAKWYKTVIKERKLPDFASSRLDGEL